MLSLIKLFLYPLSSCSNRSVSAFTTLCICSTQSTSRFASLSSGATCASAVTARSYLEISLPDLASETAALSASVERCVEHVPMRYKRSNLVLPLRSGGISYLQHRHLIRLYATYRCSSKCMIQVQIWAVLKEKPSVHLSTPNPQHPILNIPSTLTYGVVSDKVRTWLSKSPSFCPRPAPDCDASKASGNVESILYARTRPTVDPSGYEVRTLA